MLIEATHLIDSEQHTDALLILLCGNGSVINRDLIAR